MGREETGLGDIQAPFCLQDRGSNAEVDGSNAGHPAMEEPASWQGFTLKSPCAR